MKYFVVAVALILALLNGLILPGLVGYWFMTLGKHALWFVVGFMYYEWAVGGIAKVIKGVADTHLAKY